MCETCEQLRTALAAAELDLSKTKSARRMAVRDANAAWQVARAPDATLRAMVSELLQDVQRLADEHARMREELDTLRLMVGE